MSKTKKIISLLLTVALVMTMATVAIVSASAATTVYFENSAGWGSINVYYWGGAETPTWPGVPATDLGNNIWSAEIADGSTGIIFNDGANQTSDLSNPGDGYIAKLDGGMGGTEYGEKPSATWEVYGDTPVDSTPIESTPIESTPIDTPVTGEEATVYFSNGNAWSAVYIHYWDNNGGGTTWPGETMELAFTNDFGQDVYKFTVPAGTSGIIFNDGGDPATQTEDITSGIVNNAGFYIDMNSTQNELGHWGYGTWTYEPTDTPVDTTPTETTPSATETTPAETTPSATETTPAETTPSATETTPAETTPSATETTPAGTGITVAGTTTDAAVDSTVKYVVDLTAARLFENIQAIVTYDADKLELVRIKSDDPDVEDWEVEGPAFCPNLDGVILNAGTEGVVKFNASKVAGYNFKEEKNLVTLEFKVKDTAANEIALTIEEMTIKGGDESYFTGGQAVITEGITVEEYLVADTPIVTVPTTEKTEPTTEKTEPTTEKTEPTTEKTEPTTEKTEPTTEKTEPTTEKTEPTTEKTEPTESKPVVTQPKETDVTSNTDGSKPGVDTPPTGAATYVYVVLAVLAMAACAVVVLRKKVNG